MTVYAMTQKEGISPNLTAGKKYEVIEGADSGLFRIRFDNGTVQACLWDDCAHLGGGSWQRVEESEEDTLTTILEQAAEHDAKAKHHAAEHERLMQQARDMLPDGWRLVKAEDMVQAVTEDPREWIKGNIDPADGSVQTVTLTEDVSLAPTQDMSDPANWREGDYIVSPKGRMDLQAAYPYKIESFDRDGDPLIKDESGRVYAHGIGDFRFHHRPNT